MGEEEEEEAEEEAESNNPTLKGGEQKLGELPDNGKFTSCSVVLTTQDHGGMYAVPPRRIQNIQKRCDLVDMLRGNAHLQRPTKDKDQPIGHGL